MTIASLFPLPLWLLIVSASIALGALVMTLINLRVYRRSDPNGRVVNPDGTPDARRPMVHVCIPARNEEANLDACVRAILASDDPHLRVYVYDDQSTDATPGILARLCESDARVIAAQTRPLSSGWVGKQWACFNLAQTALQGARDDEYLLFIDADVRLAPSCIRRTRVQAMVMRADLLSSFPRQITQSIGEALLVPMIHFILFSYLPFARMRNTNDPSASAACGQFMFFRAGAYRQTGGHELCKDSMHDGVKLPRAFRKAGLRTDLFDATDISSCRMYHGLRASWRGFAKNAYEGLGSPALLIFLTVLHALGHVLPWVHVAWAAIVGTDQAPMAHHIVAAAAVLINVFQRALLAARFRQSNLGAILHPVSIIMMTLVQWHSYALHLLGVRSWKGRTQGTGELSRDQAGLTGGEVAR